ncbi:Start control protein cdc10 [Grifola frondosa]|uniref:Start control protein cdc10 n=1 Tax=Grifola frondosa TaxID=5627 RepID=A0A1C7MF54_GRIFR|nr:Start control protein cdc10 [Grifola frondosa]
MSRWWHTKKCHATCAPNWISANTLAGASRSALTSRAEPSCFSLPCAMQSVPRTPAQQPPVKIYNAVYSSVQVYECMVRGIAVMRRRADSYVNATQILKVAGVDKGRRTKILEKEILPGKHEIVQGGYGKYQGTWIPLERGRDIAIQYGVAPLLAPLFDFVPNANPLGALPPGLPNVTGTPGNFAGGGLAPPPSCLALRSVSSTKAAPRAFSLPRLQSPFQSMSGVSPTPPPIGQSSLKRTRSDLESDFGTAPTAVSSQTAPPALAASPDIQMVDRSRPPSTTPHGDGLPSPTKRARTEPPPPLPETAAGLHAQASLPLLHNGLQPSPLSAVAHPMLRPASSNAALMNGKMPDGQLEPEVHRSRFSSKPFHRLAASSSLPTVETRHANVVSVICSRDDPANVLELLRESSSEPLEVDAVLDEQGHTALHLAASMARLATVEALIANGADVHRGNLDGETPLIRACLSPHNADQQTFHLLVAALHESIRTLDTSRKSVLHHVVALAGVKGRAVVARYYLDQIFSWIAHNEGGDFRSLVDLQDEHGDTALNIAARVGNRILVRVLLDVGANRILPNKLGLRPGDFGVETEELGSGPRAEDILSSLRSGPSAPVQKSQDVIADISNMIQSLGNDFAAEVKAKQDGLDVTQAHLRAATRELSEQRKQIQQWQARCGELDQASQRVRNLEKALVEEDSFDWTGRTELDGSDAAATAGPAFQVRGQGSTMSGIAGSVDISFNLDVEPTVPVGDSVASLIRLRRLTMWHGRMEQLMEARLRLLQGASAEKEFQCKKIVALCTGLSVDKVEESLENLLVAVESESQIIDIGRVSGFMQKVRNGVI